jgi:glutamyl-tRNA synthetase
MLRALGVEPPIYAHLPMVLGEDGQRLSKRHGAVSVLQYKEAGYLPDGLLNYLARLGWSHGDQEIFSRDELIQFFDLAHINGAPGKFDADKCLWTNQQHLLAMSGMQLARHVAPHLAAVDIDVDTGPALSDVCECLRERSKTVGDLAMQAHYFYHHPTVFDEEVAAKHWTTASAVPVLTTLHTIFDSIDTWSTTEIHDAMQQAGKDCGVKMGQVGMPLRLALTGSGQSPAIDQVSELLGKTVVIERLARAIAHINRMAS